MERWERRLTWSAVALAGVIAVAVAAVRRADIGSADSVSTAKASRYHCPMHPSYVSDKPGDCPICGMKLVPMESSSPSAAPPSADPHAGHIGMTTDGTGRAVFALSPGRREMLGVRSEAVRLAPLDRTIRTVGRVAVDERRLHHIHTKYEAYVEHLHVDFTGKFVRKGQPLLALYSPELVATQQEYLLAFRAQRQLGGSTLPEVARGGVDLLEAARQRLLLWDVSAADIARLDRTGEVQRTLNLYSPVSGYVMEKTAYHGMRVTPADTLFDIADLSHLWVLADVYESDLAAVRTGMPAELSVASLPGSVWGGTVTWVAPMVEEKTRTVKVRVEVDNRGGTLKPEMFADVVLKRHLGEGLVVPESAVVHAGERQLVFLDRADGRLEPRAIQLGGKVVGGVQVMGGLAEGDQVVTSANFLLDSESSLKAALAGMTASGEPPAPGAHRH